MGSDWHGTVAERIFGLNQKSRSALLKSELIKSIMKKRVITVTPDTSNKDTAMLMTNKKIGCVPILSDGALVGLVTTTNVLHYLGLIA